MPFLRILFLFAVGFFYSCCVYSISSVQPDTLSYCDSIWPPETKADFFQYTFIPQNGTPGVIKSKICSHAFCLCEGELELRHDGTYEIVLEAIYLPDNPSGKEIRSQISKEGEMKIVVASQRLIELKQNFRCPATVSTGGGFRANESICGAINYTVELIEINACGGKDTLSKAVQFETPSTEPRRKFCYEENERGWHRWYRVRWRPNFSYGPGIFGHYHDCFIAASRSDFACETEVTQEIESVVEVLRFRISETVPGGVQCWGILDGHLEMKIRIINPVGRVVAQEIANFRNGEQVIIKSLVGLKSGLYIIEFSSVEDVFVERFVQE